MTTPQELLEIIKKELSPLIDENLDGMSFTFKGDVWRLKRLTTYVKDGKPRVCFNFEVRLED